jgi:hypothetical protein
MSSIMSKRIPAGTIVTAAALLVAVFWAGRASAPRVREESSGVNRLPARFSDRSGSRPPVRTGGPGAGGQAIASAMQLRDVFKNSGGNMQLGSAMADAALSRMNAAEISRLVEDLAQAQASTPGYNFTLEIQAACARWAEVDPRAALRFVLSSRQASFRNAALGSLFAGMAKLDPAMARAELAVIEDPSLRRSAQASLLSALAVADPDEWVATLLADPSLHEQYGMASIVSEWAMDDPAKAAERLGKLPAKLQASGVVSLAKVWASKDAGAAQAWALSLGDSKQRQLALGAVAGGIAARDPDAALASLDALDSSARQAGIKAVFSTLVDLDFDLALEKASAISDPAEKNAVLKILAGTDYYSGDDPFASSSTYNQRNSGQLVKLLAELPPGDARNSALNRLGSQLGSATPDEAERILAGYSGRDHKILRSQMLEQMTQANPAGALELYQSLPVEQRDDSTFRNIITNLASRDPEAALELALGSESEDVRARGTAQAFSSLAERDPEAASKRLDLLPSGSLEHQSALLATASVWASRDPDAASVWAAGLDPDSRVLATGTLVPAIAEHDPVRAARLLGDIMQSGANDTQGNLATAASQLVHRWAKSNPAAAAEWTAALEESPAKSFAVTQLVTTWHPQDPDGAAEWVDRLPGGVARDSGVRQMIQASQNDPAAAFGWAATLSDGGQRSREMEYIAAHWIASDREQARAAIRQSDLPAEVRQRLLESAE